MNRLYDGVITAAVAREVRVLVGPHYAGGQAIVLDFVHGASTTREAMNDAAAVRQLGLELIQAANVLDGVAE